MHLICFSCRLCLNSQKWSSKLLLWSYNNSKKGTSSYERRMLHCAKALSREGDLDHAECIYSSFVTSATFWKPWIIFKSRISQIVTEDLGCGREQYFTHICSLLLWKKQRKIKVGKKKIFNLLWWSDLYVLGLFFVFMFLIFFLRHEKASMFSCQCQRCIFKRSYLHGKAGTPTPWHWSCSWFKKERGGGRCRNASRFTESQTPTVTLL